MSSDSHATITYTSMSSYEVIVNGLHTRAGVPKVSTTSDDMLPVEEQPLPATLSPTAESPRYITESEPEMEPEENDGDDDKSEGDSIDYLTSGGDNDANDDGDDLLEDDADDEDKEDESIPEAAIPLRKRARFTTPTSRYEIGESSVAAAAARQIRPTLTKADKRRADDKLIGRLRRE
nr:hypothetical protein [Tanacetum cinerariifolium]